ncbi:G-protein pathway suppressor, partial [Dermatophagoides farinae]
MASLSIVDKINHQHKSHLKHFVVQTRSFQIEKSRNMEMYPRLRIHIQRQNEKRKQEMEMSEELKRAKREKELKHNLDKRTLDEIKEEITRKERKLADLGSEKHKLFAEFKKVCNEDNSRKNLQRQKEASVMLNLTFGPSQSGGPGSQQLPLSLATLPSSSSSAATSSALALSQSQLNQNVASLKFPNAQHHPSSITNSNSIIPPLPNPTIMPLHESFYAVHQNASGGNASHPSNKQPPPQRFLSAPPVTMAVYSANYATQLERQQQQRSSVQTNSTTTSASLPNVMPSVSSPYSLISNSKVAPPPPPTPIYSKPPPSSSMNPALIAGGIPFQAIPPTGSDRLPRLSSSSSAPIVSSAGYKRLHESSNPTIVSSTGSTLPTLNLAAVAAAAHSGHQQVHPTAAHIPAFLSAYPPPPPSGKPQGQAPPPGSILHPVSAGSAAAAFPPGLSLTPHMQSFQNSIFHQSLIMGGQNPFLPPNTNPPK